MTLFSTRDHGHENCKAPRQRHPRNRSPGGMWFESHGTARMAFIAIPLLAGVTMVHMYDSIRDGHIGRATAIALGGGLLAAAMVFLVWVNWRTALAERTRHIKKSMEKAQDRVAVKRRLPNPCEAGFNGHPNPAGVPAQDKANGSDAGDKAKQDAADGGKRSE